MTHIEETIAAIRRNVEKLVRIELDLARVRGGLEPLPGGPALDVALGNVGGAKAALAQAEEELEVEDGLYLDDPAEAERLDEKDRERYDERGSKCGPGCGWCGACS